jgi:hypothetical protein
MAQCIGQRCCCCPGPVQVRVAGATDDQCYEILCMCIDELEKKDASISDVKVLCKEMTDGLRDSVAFA